MVSEASVRGHWRWTSISGSKPWRTDCARTCKRRRSNAWRQLLNVGICIRLAGGSDVGICLAGYSERERRKMLDAVDLFRDHDTAKR